jgi:Flp pilus assembly protein TadB
VSALAVAIAVLLAGRRWAAPPVRRTHAAPSHRVRRRRPRPPGPEHYAVFVDDIARSVRSGDSVHHACDMAVGRHPVVANALHGDSADAALVNSALRVAVHFGGASARGLDATASVLRERAAIAADRRAHAAQALLSARVLTGLPLVVAAGMVVSSPAVRRASLTSAVGQVCMAAGLTLCAVGWWWMRRIVRAGT